MGFLQRSPYGSNKTRRKASSDAPGGISRSSSGLSMLRGSRARETTHMIGNMTAPVTTRRRKAWRPICCRISFCFLDIVGLRGSGHAVLNQSDDQQHKEDHKAKGRRHAVQALYGHQFVRLGDQDLGASERPTL